MCYKEYVFYVIQLFRKNVCCLDLLSAIVVIAIVTRNSDYIKQDEKKTITKLFINSDYIMYLV